MQHQVKGSEPGYRPARAVIDALSERFELIEYDTPEPEPDESK